MFLPCARCQRMVGTWQDTQRDIDGQQVIILRYICRCGQGGTRALITLDVSGTPLDPNAPP